MGERKAISKTLRFEVLKRDSFTCQYCGAKSPDVLLEIDHVIPVADDGDTNVLNLVTACAACNRGKRDRKLSDSSVVEKQRVALEDRQARLEQLEMMVQWQRDMVDLNQYELSVVAQFWLEKMYPYQLIDAGLEQLQKWLKRYSVQEVLDAIRISADTYIERDENRKITAESIEVAWMKVGGICATKRREKENPRLKDVYYIRKILTNRFGASVDPVKSMVLIQLCIDRGVPVDTVVSLAKTTRSLADFKHACNDALE